MQTAAMSSTVTPIALACVILLPFSGVGGQALGTTIEQHLSSVASEPEVVAFVRSMQENELEKMGLSADDPILAAQLLLTHLQLKYTGTPPERIAALRTKLIQAGIPEAALESSTARGATRSALSALAQSVGTREEQQLVRFLARCDFGIDDLPADKGRLSSEGARLIQLQALGILHNKGPDAYAHFIKARVQSGLLDAALLDRAALEKVAIEETAARLSGASAVGRPLIIAQAEDAYGLDGQALYDVVPACEDDVGTLLRQYEAVPSGSSDAQQIVDRLRQCTIRPEHVPALAQAIEKATTPQSRVILLRLFENGWSIAGRDYLYSRLVAGVPREESRVILKVLTRRGQIGLDPLATFISSSDDDELLGLAFELLRRGISRGDENARLFVYAALGDRNARIRDLASRTLADVGERKDIPKLIATAQEATDPEERASLIAHLRFFSTHPQVEAFLFGVLDSDASTTVRVSAVKTISLTAATGGPVKEREEEKIARLREIAARIGDPALTEAVEAKIEDYTNRLESTRREHMRITVAAIRLAIDVTAQNLPEQPTSKDAAPLRDLIEEADRLLGQASGDSDAEWQALKTARERAVQRLQETENEDR